MTAQELRDQTRLIVSTACFAWTMVKPEMLQTIHRMGLQSSPATAHITAPFDEPVEDMVTNTAIRPSEMQIHLLRDLVPGLLAAVQSVAEDLLEARLDVARPVDQIARAQDLALI